MRESYRYLTLIGLLATGCAPHFTGPQYIRHIAYLAGDDLGGRGIGTPGIDLAAEYIARQFREAGLDPGGENGTYFQSFDIPMGQEMLGRPTLAVAGAPALGLVGRDFIPFPFSEPDAFEGPLAFAGYGITNPDEHYDDYEGFDATGKVLLLFRYEPRAADPKAKFGGQSPSQHSSFQAKAGLARTKGAKAVLIVNPPLGHGHEDRLFVFNTVDYTGRFGLPMLHVTREYAGRLLKAAGADDLTTLQRDLDQRKPHSTNLAGLTAHGEPGLTPRKIKARNVIAELHGCGPNAGEYVVIGAHYDHIGRVLSSKGDGSGRSGEPRPQIHNGADDNASGTAGVIELARAFGPRGSPDRSILFMAFSGEEEGLLGSAHYIHHPTVSTEKLVAMINLDMIGRLRSSKLEIYGMETATEFDRLLKYRARLLGLRFKAIGTGYGPSDQAPFYEKQVPVLFFFTGLHSDYHMPTDDTPKINAEGGARVVQLAYSVTESMAAAPGRPTYTNAEKKGQDDQTGQNDRKDRPRPGLKVRLGVMPSFAADDQPGLLIQGVSTDSPAERAGLREGDRILKLGDTEVKDVYGLMEAMKRYNPGDKAKVSVQHGDKQMEFEVKFEASGEEKDEKKE